MIGIILDSWEWLGMPTLPEHFISFDFELQAAGACFSGISELFANPFQAFVVIFSFLFVDFFDTNLNTCCDWKPYWFDQR